MAWQDVMLGLLRPMVNDMASATYNDDTLEQVLVVAAFQVLREPLSFAFDYTADVENTDITPDPTDSDSQDDAFVNLVAIKAACIVDTGSAAGAATQAIMVKDGASMIDLRGALAGKLALLRQGWCATYKEAKFEHQSGSLAGAAVMTPFRLYAGGATGYRSDDRGDYRF